MGMNMGTDQKCRENLVLSIVNGGEGGIRTPDTLASMPHFECGAFNHSATSPSHWAIETFSFGRKR